MRNLQTLIKENPVTQAELRHQWYVIETSRSGRVWIILAGVMLLPALLTSIGLFLAGLFGAPIQLVPTIGIGTDLGQTVLSAGQTALLVMNVAMYFVVMMVSFGPSANSIAREKRGRTWDSLLLTNISAARIVWGKWWASIRALDGDQVMVGLLRLGLVAWVIVGLRGALVGDTAPVQVHLLLISVLVIGFSVIDAAFNTALALLSVLAALPGALTFALYGTVRLIVTGTAVGLFVALVNALYSDPRELNGAPPPAPDFSYFFVGLAVLAGFVVLTFVTLRLAEVAAVVGSHASPRAENPA